MVENPNFSQPESTEAEVVAYNQDFMRRAKERISQEVVELLNGLTHKERRVLQLGFGLEDGKAKAPTEIGEIVGMELRGRPYLTRWVKRTEARALYKLRHPVMSGPELGVGLPGAEVTAWLPGSPK